MLSSMSRRGGSRCQGPKLIQPSSYQISRSSMKLHWWEEHADYWSNLTNSQAMGQFCDPCVLQSNCKYEMDRRREGEGDNRIGGDTINSCHLGNKKISQVVFISELFETQGNLILAR